jgi:hypothetical protein
MEKSNLNCRTSLSTAFFAIFVSMSTDTITDQSLNPVPDQCQTDDIPSGIPLPGNWS